MQGWQQMNERAYKRLVRGFGVYHALAVSPLVLPAVSDEVLALLARLHEALGLPGAVIDTSAGTMMFVNLFAAAALVWALYRVGYPDHIVGRFEGVGMLLFSALEVFHVAQGASLLWLAIPLVDLPGALLHLYYARDVRT